MEDVTPEMPEIVTLIGGWRSQSWSGVAKLRIAPDSLLLGWLLMPLRLRCTVERIDVLDIWPVRSGHGFHTRSGPLNGTVFSAFHLTRCGEQLARFGWPIRDEWQSMGEFRRLCGDLR
jgi:hypothetical protein